MIPSQPIIQVRGLRNTLPHSSNKLSMKFPLNKPIGFSFLLLKLHPFNYYNSIVYLYITYFLKLVQEKAKVKYSWIVGEFHIQLL